MPEEDLQQPHVKILWGNSSKPLCALRQGQASNTIPITLNWMGGPLLPVMSVILLLGGVRGGAFRSTHMDHQGTQGL